MENVNTKREQARLDLEHGMDVQKTIRKRYGKWSYFYQALKLVE